MKEEIIISNMIKSRGEFFRREVLEEGKWFDSVPNSANKILVDFIEACIEKELLPLTTTQLVEYFNKIDNEKLEYFRQYKDKRIKAALDKPELFKHLQNKIDEYKGFAFAQQFELAYEFCANHNIDATFFMRPFQTYEHELFCEDNKQKNKQEVLEILQKLFEEASNFECKEEDVQKYMKYTLVDLDILKSLHKGKKGQIVFTETKNLLIYVGKCINEILTNRAKRLNRYDFEQLPYEFLLKRLDLSNEPQEGATKSAIKVDPNCIAAIFDYGKHYYKLFDHPEVEKIYDKFKQEFLPKYNALLKSKAKKNQKPNEMIILFWDKSQSSGQLDFEKEQKFANEVDAFLLEEFDKLENIDPFLFVHYDR